jgi:hypothetical protein
VNYPLDPSDYEAWMVADGKPTKAMINLKAKIGKELQAERASFREARAAVQK